MNARNYVMSLKGHGRRTAGMCVRVQVPSICVQ